MALQEVKLNSTEFKSFDTRAACPRLRLFWCSATTKMRDGREQGGVVLLVSKLYKSRLAAKFSSCGGQASLVWVNGCLFGSCYAAHHDQRLDFLKEVFVCVGTQSSLSPFYLVGDWNDEPQEAPLAMALEGAGARVVATEQPTRWGGKRCLDYMITNVPAEPGIGEIQHSTQAYSDHKLMICSCQIRGEPRVRWRLQATAQYAIPENCSKDRWHHEVTQTWREKESRYQPVREARELSTQYQQLCREVEAALATAALLCNGVGKKPRGARPKGSAAQFEVIPEMPAKADPIDESFETRVTRNALGQLKELAALEVGDHQPRTKREAADKLREKLLRTRKVDLERPRYLEITRLERILETVRKKKLEERMQRWRNRMKENPSHVSDGWMASKARRSTTSTMKVTMM